MTGSKINVGILLRSKEIPAWHHHLIQELMASGSVSIKAGILAGSDVVTRRTAPHSFLFKLVARVKRAQPSAAPDACERREPTDALRDVAWLRLPDDGAPDAREERAGALAEIAAQKLDVILALDAHEAIDALCPVARHGVWFFWHDFGQTACADGSAVGFWEVVKRRPYIRSALLIRRSGVDADAVGYESCSGIYHHSHARSRNEHLWKILFSVPRALKRLHKKGAELFFQESSSKPRSESFGPAARKWRLTSARLLWPIVAYAAWRLRRMVRNRLYRDAWILLFNLDGETERLRRFTKVIPPAGRFWADPYVVRRDDSYYIFFEDASVASRHGRLAVIRLEADGKHSPPSVVLERAYHLSYPFLFEWQDELFLIPESAENRTIELYRCRRFPDDWQFVRNLMENVSAYDATLVEHGGLWWMFANVQEHSGASGHDELCLFYAESPVSEHWHSHPLNPVISDVRYARPAGKLFVDDGRLYRPSQNSSTRYGYGLNINRVLKLSTTDYREEVVRLIEPDWDRSLKGVHTFNRADRLVVIDAIHRRRRRGAS